MKTIIQSGWELMEKRLGSALWLPGVKKEIEKEATGIADKLSDPVGDIFEE